MGGGGKINERHRLFYFFTAYTWEQRDAARIPISSLLCTQNSLISANNLEWELSREYEKGAGKENRKEKGKPSGGSSFKKGRDLRQGRAGLVLGTCLPLCPPQMPPPVAHRRLAYFLQMPTACARQMWPKVEERGLLYPSLKCNPKQFEKGKGKPKP